MAHTEPPRANRERIGLARGGPVHGAHDAADRPPADISDEEPDGPPDRLVPRRCRVPFDHLPTFTVNVVVPVPAWSESPKIWATNADVFLTLQRVVNEPFEATVACWTVHLPLT